MGKPAGIGHELGAVHAGDASHAALGQPNLPALWHQFAMAHVYAIGNDGGAAGGVPAGHDGGLASGYAAFVSLSGEAGLMRLGSLKRYKQGAGLRHAPFSQCFMVRGKATRPTRFIPQSNTVSGCLMSY